MTDHATIRRAQAGDRDAMGLILSQNRGAIYTTVRRYLHTGMDGDDLVQEACIAFMHAVRRYEYDRGASLLTFATYHMRARLATYLYRTRSLVRPRMSSEGRKNRETKPDRALPGNDEGCTLPSTYESPEDTAVRASTITSMRRLLRVLNPRDRRIMLARADGVTLEAIGAQFGITRERVRQLEARALRVLRHAMGAGHA